MDPEVLVQLAMFQEKQRRQQALALKPFISQPQPDQWAVAGQHAAPPAQGGMPPIQFESAAQSYDPNLKARFVDQAGRAGQDTLARLLAVHAR